MHYFHTQLRQQETSVSYAACHVQMYYVFMG